MSEDKFQLKLKEENITISSSADSTEKCPYSVLHYRISPILFNANLKNVYIYNYYIIMQTVTMSSHIC